MSKSNLNNKYFLRIFALRLIFISIPDGDIKINNRGYFSGILTGMSNFLCGHFLKFVN